MSRFKLSMASLALVLTMASQAFATAAKVYGISPNSGPVGAGSFMILVSGANFTTQSVVIFSNCSVMTTYVSSTQLEGKIPSGCLAAPGTVEAGVVNSGVMSNFAPFQIYPPLAISTASIPGGTKGTAYSATLAATGGIAPYSWSVSSGALPGGLTLYPLSTISGAISGTPTASGSYSFTVMVKDATFHSATCSYSITIGQ